MCPALMCAHPAGCLHLQSNGVPRIKCDWRGRYPSEWGARLLGSYTEAPQYISPYFRSHHHKRSSVVNSADRRAEAGYLAEKRQEKRMVG